MEITSYRQASEIWIDFKVRMYAFIQKKVRNHELAEEINAQILQKLLNSCCSGITIQHVSSWMYRMAFHAILDELKKLKKHTGFDRDLEIEDTSNVYQELTEFIEPLIGFLPEKFAVPLIMSDIEGIKQQEIARRLGLSVSGAKSRIQRARVLLKEEIRTCFHVDQENPNSLEGIQLKASCKPLQQLRNKKL